MEVTEGTLEMGDENVSLKETKAEEETIKSDKHIRHRKKRLLNQVKEQMEFYFSSANISKSQFMTECMSVSPYISLETFCTKFNKLRSMTDDPNLVRKAVQKSALLELSDDGLMVKRKEEVVLKNNETECTIYVENVPSHAEHDWLRQIFSQYGVIDYISLPRYISSNRPKGFAFVEFQTPEMADLALESFGAEKCRIPMDIDPSELQSIKSFEGDSQQHDQAGKNTANEDSGGMGTTEGEGGGGGQSKDTDGNEGETDRKKRKLEGLEVGEEKGVDSPEAGGTSVEEDGTTEKKKKKKKRKRSKKVKEDEVESIYLKVMSKREWKSLRNKYLNMQRENMMNLKKKLQDSRNKYSRYGICMFENLGMQEREQYTPDTCKTETPDKDVVMKPEFIPNAVIRINFEEPPQDPRKLRETIRVGGGDEVAYVDTSAVEKDVYVRFLSEEAASAYKKSGCWSRMEILSGSEEEEYWKCIHLCWEKRREKRNKRAAHGSNGISDQERGREKLLQKAFRESQNTKTNQHILFED